MSYFAEIHPIEHTVIQVVVADSIEWCETHISGQVQTGTTTRTESTVSGGTVEVVVPTYTPTYWLETSDPYAPAGSVTYCGPGYGADAAVRERFALPWDATAATVPNELGHWAYETQGEVVFHAGKIWRNLNPTGNPNVWTPGVANWREYPMGVAYPIWIQPVGAVDAYLFDEVVEHNGLVWRSLNAANVWEPGTDALLWEDITPPPPIADWVQPTGAGDAYNIGDRVLFESQTWESLIDGNVWSPTAYPAGWSLVEVI